MEIMKTKDVADLLSVSQTTIKRWAAMFPDFFPKDRYGHYMFSEPEVGLLNQIKDRINHGETLDCIHLNQPPKPLRDNTPTHTHDKSMENMLSRMDHIERSLDQKADEVVSVQLLQQREELEELRQMIKQLAASVETIQQPGRHTSSSYEELHPTWAAKHQSPPRKRSLLRSVFPFL